MPYDDAQLDNQRDDLHGLRPGDRDDNDTVCAIVRACPLGALCMLRTVNCMRGRKTRALCARFLRDCF